MPYRLIKGSFHIHYPDTPRNGPEPDGDTLKFQPDSRQLVESLPTPNRPAKFTQSGITTIRFEGIDALETHFMVAGEEFHQHINLALAARDELLKQSGFGQVSFFTDEHAKYKVESVQNHPVRGYILSNGLDTYGRAIAFCFVGESAFNDGANIFATADDIKSSLNVHLLTIGHAYPAFYLSLPVELREYLKTIVAQARADKVGLWEKATATTTKSATINNKQAIFELAIWPKLFRRLAAYFQDGNIDLQNFDAWLRVDPLDRDDRVLLPQMELGNMHDLISVNNNQLKLNYRPEDVVIVPDDYVLVTNPQPVITQPINTGDIRIIAALIDPKEASERGFETVTIINVADHNISLAGYKIADNTASQSLQGEIASGETLRIKLEANVRLSNRRDVITILDAQEQIVDQVTYEKKLLPQEGYSMLFPR